MFIGTFFPQYFHINTGVDSLIKEMVGGLGSGLARPCMAGLVSMKMWDPWPLAWGSSAISRNQLAWEGQSL